MARNDGLDDGCSGCGSDPCTGSTPQCPGRFRFSRLPRLVLILGFLIVTTLLSAGACDSAATTASQNVSTAADNFEVNRRIVGINLRTGENLFLVEGACSITRDGDLVVICKTGANPDTFEKHFFGLGPQGGNGVTYVSTQLEPVKAGQWHTRIILRPTTIVPDFNMETEYDG